MFLPTLLLPFRRSALPLSVRLSSGPSMLLVHTKLLVHTNVTYTAPAIPAHCPGCGAKIQTADSSKPGFFPEKKPRDPIHWEKIPRSPKVMTKADIEKAIAKLDEQLLLEDDNIDKTDNNDAAPFRRHPEPRILCNRCHSLIHQNKPTIPASPWQDTLVTNDHTFLRFLRKRQNAVIVKVVDIFDFPGSFIPDLQHLIGDNHPIILAVNKVDLLPKTALAHQQRIRDWVRTQAKKLGIAHLKDVHLISAKKNLGIRELGMSIASACRAVDDVYLVGCTNVGKSELVNALLRLEIGGSKHKVTSSIVPGTTIGMVGIPLTTFGNVLDRTEVSVGKIGQRHLYDTPGIVNERQLINLLDYEELKMVMLNQPVRPATYSLEAGKSLLIGSLARLDILSATSPPLITLFSKIPPHITSTSKVNHLFDKVSPSYHILQPPIITPTRRPFPTLQPLTGKLTLHGRHASHAILDIVFSSVGWVSIGGVFDRADIQVWCPGGGSLEDGRVIVREPPLLPNEFRGRVRKFFGDRRRSTM